MNIKKLFLIDAFGAVFSALMIGVVLVYFQPFIGMPINVLYLLSILASSFAVYSFCCYFIKFNQVKTLLKIIALLNFSYCIISLLFMIYYSKDLSLLGLIYFGAEKVIVLTLAYFEYKFAIKY